MRRETSSADVDPLVWPEGLTRVPYWAFQREDIYANEQQRIFQGDCWHYLCLETDIPAPGDFRTTEGAFQRRTEWPTRRR